MLRLIVGPTSIRAGNTDTTCMMRDRAWSTSLGKLPHLREAGDLIIPAAGSGVSTNPTNLASSP